MSENILPFNDAIAKRIDSAIENKTVELECIIDHRVVDRNTFIRVREYLENDPFYRHLNNGNPEMSLDIHTKYINRVPGGKEYISNSFERATIKGQLNVQKYCKTNKINRIDEESLEFIKKNSVVDVGAEGPRKTYFKNPWPTREQKKSGEAPYFQYRLNIKNEKELSDKKGSDGNSQTGKFIRKIYNFDKSFRYKCRWSFVTGGDRPLFRVDCTAVKSSRFNEYYPTFKESDTLGQPENYEIEIEYIGNKEIDFDLPPVTVYPDLWSKGESPTLTPPPLKEEEDEDEKLKEVDLQEDIKINADNIEDYLDEDDIYKYNRNDAAQVRMANRIKKLGYEVKVVGPSSPEEDPPPKPIYRYIPNTIDYLRAIELQGKGYEIEPREAGTYETINEINEIIPNEEMPKSIRPIIKRKQVTIPRIRGKWTGERPIKYVVVPSEDSQYKMRTIKEWDPKKGIVSYDEEDKYEYEEVKETEPEPEQVGDNELVSVVYNLLNRILENILKMVYNTDYLISDSERKDIHDGYRTVTGQSTNKYTNFIGPQPVSISIENIISGEQPNIMDNEYLVTEKADGERYLLYIHTNGYAYLYNNRHNTNEIINSGIKFPDEYQGYIFDGEYITKLANDSQTKRFYIFDVYYHKEGTRLIPTYNRLWLDSRTKDNDINKGRVKYIDEFMEHYESRQDIPEYSIKIYKKNYQYIAGNAFEAARIKLNQIDSLLNVGISLVPYKTDGLVFLPLKFPVNGMSTTEIVNQHIKQPEDIDNLAQIDEYYEREETLTKYHQSNRIGGTWFANFKWKPPELNTIDFGIKIDPKVHQMIDPEDNTKILYYKSVSLLVFYDQSQDTNIDFVEKSHQYANGLKTSYKRTIEFNPEDSPNSIGKTNIILENNKILCLEDNDEVKGDTIVEFSYDKTKPDDFKWVPLRLRKDRPKPQFKGTAESIWKTIMNPITKDMICGDIDEEQTQLIKQEVKDTNKYYNATINRDASVIKAQASFHGYIKRNLIVGVCNMIKIYKDKNPETRLNVFNTGDKNVAVLDLAVGRGGDNSKFLEEDAYVSKIFGIDLSPGNIDECCKRWWTMANWKKKGTIALFIDGDTSLNIKNGEIAKEDPEKMNLLSSLYAGEMLHWPELTIKLDSQFNNMAGQKNIFKDRKDIQFKRFKDVEEDINTSVDNMLEIVGQHKEKANNQKQIRRDMILTDPEFDLANIQFAIHYFFESPQKLDGLLKNIDENLKNGGCFIGTCFDGQRVIDFLKDVPEGKEKNYTVENYKAIAIRKEFSLLEDEFEWTPDEPNESAMLGKQISVFQETFGEYYPEYLVNFEYLKWKCAQYNLYPLEDVSFDNVKNDEYNKFLTLSMSNFSEFYNDYLFKNGEEMDEELQEFSFLNRIFIFKKILPEELTKEEEIEEDALKIREEKLELREDF
jgi:hypothetical protein